MDPFKKEQQRYEMLADISAKGSLKTKIRRQARSLLKRASKREILDPNFDKRPTRKD